ncbi:hypothetical protein [Promicromonospora sukumoe]|uniref:hypothetical protein n=1 Tax=Promicromonospora sukumoe TaxID=88382 RepID=UPI000375C19F|nr:hypothetical protein [Promicromonospora sukumoe]
MRGTTVEHLFVPGDVVRAAVAVSVVVGGATLGGLAVALFLLALGGALVPRFLGLPAVLDVCFGGCLLLAAWAALLRWYEAVPWLDLLVHAVCTGLVAAVGVLALIRWRVVASRVSGGWAHAGLVVTTTATGALGAVLWELGEWAGYTYVDEEIRVGYADTIGDLSFGVLGALAAGVVLAVQQAGRRSDDAR